MKEGTFRMRAFVLAAALLCAAAAPVAALAQAPAAKAAPVATPAVPAYSVEDTDLGTILDDPAAKAILVKHLPSVANSDQIDMARSLTPKALQEYKADEITDKVLADMQADFDKLAAKK
jgi:hypothetical protein